MIDDLRTTLARHAGEVVPVADPFGRLLVRRRRHRRTVTIGMAVAAAATLAPVGVLAANGWRGRRQDLPTLSPLVHALLDSPVRGSLADDAAFLAALRHRVAAGDPVQETPAGQSEVPGTTDPTDLSGQDDPTGGRGSFDPATLVVLFAGDITGNQRVALVAIPQRQVVELWGGPAGTPVDGLSYRTQCGLDPVLNVDNLEFEDSEQDPVVVVGANLILAPAGAQVYYSEAARYLADGTVARDWSLTPRDYLVRNLTDIRRRHRVRVNYDGVVLYQAQVSTMGTLAESEVIGPVDPTPRVGVPQPELTRRAAESLAAAGDLDVATTVFQVLWSSTLPSLAEHEKDMPVVAVFGRTPDGGGLYGIVADAPWQFALAAPGGHGFVDVVTAPAGFGVLGDPARSMIATRLFPRSLFEAVRPQSGNIGWLTDGIQIVAPPNAVRAEIVGGSSTISAALQDGVGMLTVPADVDATVRAYDPAGQLVASSHFADVRYTARDSFEPTIYGW